MSNAVDSVGGRLRVCALVRFASEVQDRRNKKSDKK